MKIVIAGSGIAGVTAAKKIREFLPDASVTLLDREGIGLYSRMRLPEVLAGKLPETKLVLSSGESLRALNLDWRGKCTLLSFDARKKECSLSDGTILSYDRLILAVGAEAQIPSIPGATESMTLRSVDDVDRFMLQAAHARRAIVIGGGLLGLEAANALHMRGIQVSIVECMPRLLPRQLLPAESEILLKKFEEFGYKVYLGRATASLCSENGGWKAVLDSGEELFSDMVMISAGIRPNTEIAKQAGAETAKGILVNQKFETSLTDVYAIGDCAQMNGVVYGLWIASKDQGEAVAGILAGRLDEYLPPVYEPSLKIPGIQLKEIRLAALSV